MLELLNKLNAGGILMKKEIKLLLEKLRNKQENSKICKYIAILLS